jgi:polyisoprenyl-teichoic acid--peptidoglycan teichoic acid transferase
VTGGGPARPGRRMWRGFGLATLSVVLLSAVAVATPAFLELSEVTDALTSGGKLDVGNELTRADVGGPQTILLLGSDRRYADIESGKPPNSDTMMLVRLDPDKPTTTVMSFPRDLEVEIPCRGVDKINAAYRFGGPKLAVQTVKLLTGLEINHVMNVNFGGFRRAVNFVDCVYVDVDRRYFNDNSGPEADYAVIDVPAGYQKLCGQDSLDYVRYRHEDNDLVRAARQQDYLRQAKEQVGVQRVLDDYGDLAKIFGRYTQTDIRDDSEVLGLLKLVIYSSGRPVRQVPFKVSSIGDAKDTFVRATPEQVQKSVEQFLGNAPAGQRGEVEPTRDEREGARKRPKQPPAEAGLEEAGEFGREQAQFAQAKVPFPVYYPTLRTQLATYDGIEPRTYTISDPSGRRYKAYRMVLKKGLVGEYYGIQGMNWTSPPILEHPSEKRRLGGREFELFFDGKRLRTVAWRTRGAVYWVSNTLVLSLTNKQMLEIAESTRPYE